MKVIRRFGELPRRLSSPVVAIGVFDGVHAGHQRVLSRVVARAQKIDGLPTVMTFHPHPVHVLRPRIHLPLLTPLEYRLDLIAQTGIQLTWVVPFTKSFAALPPEIFVRRYLVEALQAREVVVGADFRFGRDREGTMAFFLRAGERYGFRVHPVNAFTHGRKVYSSTRIRELISKGELYQASLFLRRPVTFRGRVERGDGRGRSLGYPTANLDPDDIVIPPTGVYAAGVRYQGREYDAMVNVGRRPSFQKAGRLVIEAHIFDFSRPLYGRTLDILFYKKIREEKFFHSREELVAQIRKDEGRARAVLKRRHS